MESKEDSRAGGRRSGNILLQAAIGAAFLLGGLWVIGQTANSVHNQANVSAVLTVAQNVKKQSQIIPLSKLFAPQGAKSGNVFASNFAGSANAPAIVTQDAATFQPPVYKGYIVRFTEPSLLEKKAQAEATAKKTKSILDIKSVLVSQKAVIDNQRENSFKPKLSAAIRARNPKIKFFTKVFNGVMLNITDAEAKQLKQLPEVKAVYPNYVVQAVDTQALPLIHAPDAWQLTDAASSTLTGKGVTIAIIDTGVDYLHRDLGGCLGPNCKVIGGYNFVNAASSTDPMDDMGHGTHVASIAAGKGDYNHNDIYEPNLGEIWGVAPDAKILAYKVLDNNGYGTWDTVISGIERAVDPNQDGDFSDHADVISLSLGGPGTPDDPVSLAIDNAVNNGVIAVVAAGNSGPGAYTVGSPGAARKAITVGAIDKQSYIPYFSSRGPVKWTDDQGNVRYEMKPDVVAPGVDICGAQWDHAFENYSPTAANCNNDTDHVAISGTSMATPHVAGVAALVKQLHKDWTPDEVKMAIEDSAVFDNSPHQTKGFGRVDALQAVQSPRPPVANLAPQIISGGIINIIGTATDGNFKEYDLFYGQGGDPSGGSDPISFTALTSSTSQVSNGILYSGFDTTQLSEGFYELKLVVKDANGNSSQDRQIIYVNNMEIDSVGNTMNYVNHGNQIIKGSISIPSATQFKIDYSVQGREGARTALCPPTNIPTGGTLCTFNADSLTDDGPYSLILSVFQNGAWKDDSPFRIAVVHELFTGWPGDIYGFPRDVHSVSNLGADKIPSWIIPHFLTCGAGWCGGANFYLYKSDATYKRIDSFMEKSGATSSVPDTFFGSLSSIYFDSSYQKNLMVVVGDKTTKIVDKDGAVVSNWDDYGWPRPTMAPATIFDRNHDGRPEVYTMNFDIHSGQISLLGHTTHGSVLSGFPINTALGDLPYTIVSPHIGFLKNGTEERPTIIAGTINTTTLPYFDVMHLKLYADIYGGDNKPVSRTFLFDDASKDVSLSFTWPVIADLNGDGNSELVVGYSLLDADIYLQDKNNINAYKTYIKVIDSNGAVLAQKEIDGYTMGKLAVGNLRNGKPTIVATLNDTWASEALGKYQKLVAFDGELNSVFDIDLSDPAKLIRGLTLGDVNGDGKSDIVLDYVSRWFNGTPSGVEIFDGSGTLERDIEIPTMGAVDDYEYREPILTDFNGDGITDVVLESDFLPSDFHAGFGNSYETRLYPLTLGNSYNPQKIDWSTALHDNQRTGCFGCAAVTSTSISSIDVVFPTGGEKLAAGSDMTVTWTSQNLSPTSSVDVYLSRSLTGKPGDVSAQAVRVTNTGSTTWRLGFPAPVAPGTYYIRITCSFDPTCEEGDSGAFSVLPGITLLSPKGGETFTSDINIRWTSSTVPTSTWMYVSLSSASSSRTGASRLVSNTGNTTWPISGITPGQYYVSIGCSSPDSSCIGDKSGLFTIIPPPPPAVTVIGSPSLRLKYDSAGGESALEATFIAGVHAGGTDLQMYKYFQIYAYDGSSTYAYPDSSDFKLVSGNGTDTVDMYGNGYYIIPANTTATFQARSYFTPRKMFAGEYYATLSGVSAQDASGYSFIQPSPNQTNKVLIVGEISPYISSATPNPADVAKPVTISGVRFPKTGGIVTVANHTFAQSSLDGKTITFTPRAHGVLPAGYQGVSVTDPTTGASNYYYADFETTDPVRVQGVDFSSTAAVVGDTITITIRAQNQTNHPLSNVFISAADQQGWGSQTNVNFAPQEDRGIKSGEPITFTIYARDIHTTYNPHHFSIQVNGVEQTTQDVTVTASGAASGGGGGVVSPVSLTLLSPASAVTWKQGSTQTLIWKSSGIPSSAAVTLFARPVSQSASGNLGVSANSGTSGNTGQSGNLGAGGSTEYILKANTQNDGNETLSLSSLPIGSYYIGVRAVISGGTVQNVSTYAINVVGAMALTSTPALVCSPKTQSVSPNSPATITLTGGAISSYDIYSPGAIPSFQHVIGSGASISVAYPSPSATPYVITINSVNGGAHGTITGTTSCVVNAGSGGVSGNFGVSGNVSSNMGVSSNLGTSFNGGVSGNSAAK